MLLFPPAAADAASPVNSPYSCSGTTCQVPAGTYTTTAQQFMQDTASYGVTNHGSILVSIPAANGSYEALTWFLAGAAGTDSSDSHTAPTAGGNSGNLTYANGGAITQTGSGATFTGGFSAIALRTIGGDGGNYQGTDAAQNGASAGLPGSLAFTNSAAVTVSGTSSTDAASVISVQSVGGAGGSVASIGPDHNGNPQYHTANGTAGATGSSVTVTNAAPVTIGGVAVTSGLWGFVGKSQGGNGGTGNDGTAGGNAGGVTFTNNAPIQMSGQWRPTASPQGMFTLYAESIGGSGNQSVNSQNDGGSGGSGNLVTVTLNQAGPVTLAVATQAGATPGASAAAGAFSIGGAGGAGYDHSVGGFGGATGQVLFYANSASVTATGPQASGLIALVQGGAGGASGLQQDNSVGGNGGSTGYAVTNNPANMAVYVGLSGSTRITAGGSNASGVTAASLGGAGGTGMDYVVGGSQGTTGGVGGNGGNAGQLQVVLSGTTQVATTGDQSPGIVAVVRGGNGGHGGDNGSNATLTGEGHAGNGGDGGQAAPVFVQLDSGTAVSTSGAPAADGTGAAHGIVASSIGGPGAAGGALYVLEGGGGSNGGPGGGGYDVTVTIAAGAGVTTAGANAIGVYATSLGGEGGAAGPVYNGGIASASGNGGASGNSGAVAVTNGGLITTTGSLAHGIFAQSMTGQSGDGGSGGTSGGFFISGGDSGSSGTVGAASVTNTGTIRTAGTGAIGIIAQAAGGGTGEGGQGGYLGGGGNAPYASNGGAATIDQAGTIATTGAYALGALAQSIGGGGGSGGSGTGAFRSIGGSGGGGGGGATTTVDTSGSISTAGNLAHGIIAQSIGGGGGTGGDSTAEGLVVAVSIGGSGGSGGSGGPVSVNGTGGTITTQGTKSIGIVAHSIGGGGGAAGAAYAYDASAGFGAAVAVGGSGGSGGSGATVSATLAGTMITTGTGVETVTPPPPAATPTPSNLLPVDAFGVTAQSIGGGGGVGGSASANALVLAVPSPETGNQYSAAVTVATGGSGGAGGSGGTVGVALTQGTAITTQGQGAHGVMAQSIGGGGGTGGDSSSLAATLSYGRIATASDTNTYSAAISVAVGGTGGVAGLGGPVTAEIGGQNGLAAGAASVTTFGDYADGVLAHSIGGGGGNGGYGSTTTQAFGASASITLGAGLGGAGGSGQDGGSVTARVYPGGSIRTYGESAIGLAAQSIGGGGGASQGGTVNLGASYAIGDGTTISPGFNGTFQWGGTGAGGGSGGPVTVTVTGGITTSGGDSPAVLAQSIGGGGGLGGSAGATASADNPISKYIGVREFVSAILEKNVPLTFHVTAALGGTGGAAGEGGSVTVNQSGAIATSGDWAQGIIAQSIGGGGGKGGTATSNTAGALPSLGFAVGGSGGAGGNGGTVTINLQAPARIVTGQPANGTTAGYGAIGVLAQSIGGGGGHGADGSPGSTGVLSIGGGFAGPGGAAGNGGGVTLGGPGSITTLGDAAPAIVLQSIGGGGGAGGTGSSLSDDLGPVTGQISLNVGGANGSSGTGGPVTVTPSVLAIATSGQNAYGILAQSIGGGGGFGFTAPNNTTVTNTLGSRNVPATAAGSYGNDVSITLSAGSAITTTGGGSHAIVAQSVGGGGGIAGFPAETLTLQRASGSVNGNGSGNGDGGQVTIDVNAAIRTSGAGAFGILAQSVGGGGGLLASGSTLYVGTTGGSSATGSGGALRITQSGGSITTSGANTVGIFAQSTGLGAGGAANNNFVDVTVNGTVSGGGGANGFAIWVDSGTTANAVTIGTTGLVGAASGNAIHYSGNALLNVTNNGTLTGDVHLNGDAGTGTLTNNGTYNGVSATTANVVNAGVLTVGWAGAFSTGTITGNLTQLGTGVLVVDADFANRQNDALVLQGNAVLAGQIRPVITSVLPGIALPVLTVTGSIIDAGIQGATSSLFGYSVGFSGNVVSLAATSADFAPARFNLAASTAAVAGHLQAAWNAGGTPALGPLFALLGNTADADGAAAYAAQLRQLSPDASFAPGARSLAGAQYFANATLSCPQFESTTAMLTEGQCAWMRVGGRTAGQDSSAGISSFRLGTTTWQIGGQKDMGAGWLLGGSLAYETSSLSSADHLDSGNGQGGYGALVLKYQTGPWLFAASAFGGVGHVNTARVISLPGFAGVATGGPDTSNAGVLLRTSYTIGQEMLYLRPTLSLSAIHVRTGAYQEAGGGILNLSVHSASQTTAMLTPALEIGSRAALGDGMLLRSFLVAGVSVLSNDRWRQSARLTGAPAGTGSFATELPVDQVAGRLTAGLQLYTGRMIDIRAQYEGEYGGRLIAHGGTVAASLRF